VKVAQRELSFFIVTKLSKRCNINNILSEENQKLSGACDKNNDDRRRKFRKYYVFMAQLFALLAETLIEDAKEVGNNDNKLLFQGCFSLLHCARPASSRHC